MCKYKLQAIFNILLRKESLRQDSSEDSSLTCIDSILSWSMAYRMFMVVNRFTGRCRFLIFNIILVLISFSAAVQNHKRISLFHRL